MLSDSDDSSSYDDPELSEKLLKGAIRWRLRGRLQAKAKEKARGQGHLEKRHRLLGHFDDYRSSDEDSSMDEDSEAMDVESGFGTGSTM